MNKKRAYLLIGLLIGFYSLQNSPLWKQLRDKVGTTWIEWLFWASIILFVLYGFPKMRDIGRKNKQHHVIFWAFNIGIAYIIAHIAAGICFGFGKSPYDHSLMGIFRNIFTIGLMVIGRELVRTYLVKVFYNKKSFIWLVVIVLFMTATQISFSRVLGINNLETFTVFCAEYLLPRLSENILATYLVMYGGIRSSLVYLAFVNGFEWLSPILPDIEWLIKSIITMGVPIIGTIFVMNQYMVVTRQIKKKHEKENLWTLIPSAAFSVIIVWFAVGVFPIYPSVIATGSMEPMIKPGDVILVNKITDASQVKELKNGDVIQFQRDDILITHRIIDVLEVEGQTVYETKGDNNSGKDQRLVEQQEVKGTLAGIIPKIGWPTLWLKTERSNVPEDVEF